MVVFYVFAQVGGCISGRLMRVKGYQIFPSRLDNVYPPADDTNKAKKTWVLLNEAGEVLKAFKAQSDAGIALGLSSSQVSNAINGIYVPKVGHIHYREDILLRETFSHMYRFDVYFIPTILHTLHSYHFFLKLPRYDKVGQQSTSFTIADW
jgi:hypothetical protein